MFARVFSCCARMRAASGLCQRRAASSVVSISHPFSVSQAPRPGLASDAGSAPVAVLLGWLGAKDRGLQKYAELYHHLGCESVLRYTAPAKDVFLNRDALRSTAERALDNLSQTYAGRPAILVSFSNGGAFVHEQVAELLREDALRPVSERRYGNARIVATVFDSAPAALTLAAGTRAITGSIKHPLLRRMAFASCYAVLTAAIPFIWDRDRPAAYFASLLRDPLRVPSMYIYSDTDEITDAVALARFVQDRRAVLAGDGVPVREWRVGADVRSPHVSHFQAQPDAYREALRRFLREDARVSSG